MVVHTVKDGKKDTFAAATGGKSAHGANASTDFHKEPFDDISGAEAFPMRPRTV
jgi:hypothetical protein